MNHKLFPVTVATVFACAFFHPVSSAPAADTSAANQYMHQAEFDKLVARFEDPARKQWQKPEKIVADLGPLEGKTVADIGAGTGYFSFPVAEKAGKVIAIDIDQQFLDYIDRKKQARKTGANIETRLTAPDAPGLKKHEADIVLIVDTYHHIDNRTSYFKKLKKGLAKNGVLVVVDFKKKQTPPGPPVDLRLGEEQVESELKSAGFVIASTDKDTLPYQYIIKAK